MSSEKRAEFAWKLLKAHKKDSCKFAWFVELPLRSLLTLREKILSGYESFYIFVAEFRNKLKKGGNGKQKNYYNDLVF